QLVAALRFDRDAERLTECARQAAGQEVHWRFSAPPDAGLTSPVTAEPLSDGAPAVARASVRSTRSPSCRPATNSTPEPVDSPSCTMRDCTSNARTRCTLVTPC